MKNRNALLALLSIIPIAMGIGLMVQTKNYKQATKERESAIAERNLYDSLYRVANGKLIEIGNSFLWQDFVKKHQSNKNNYEKQESF